MGKARRNNCTRRGGCSNLITFNRQRMHSDSSGNAYAWYDFEENGIVSGNSMNIARTPWFIYGVYKNGQRLTLGVDYTFSISTITFLFSLSTDLITVTYTTQVMQLTEDTSTITGTGYVLSNIPLFIYGVYKNGQRLTLTTDYTIVGATITFIESLIADSITVSYKY